MAVISDAFVIFVAFINDRTSLVMDKSIAKHLIVEYQQMAASVELIERDYTLSDGLNHVLVGLRRAGKSYLLYQQIKALISAGHSTEEMLYFNFEDDRLEGLTLADLDTIKTSYEELFPHRPIFLLDEVQNIEGWEHFARRIADQRYRVYITGSNARMLSREIAGTLGGRYMVESVYPYSFSEYLRASGITLTRHWELSPERAAVVRHYNTYLHYGGLPEVQAITPAMRRAWLNNLYNKIFFGDILMRYSVRNTMALKVMMRKLAESVGQPCSYTRIAGVVAAAGVKTRAETIIDYIEYAKDSCLIFEVENYAAKIAEKMANKKYYFADNGILNLFLLNPNPALIENIVAIALHAHYEDVCYYHDSVEVDFYLWEQRTAIQVAWTIADVTTRERETRALIRLSRRLPVEHMFIITNDEQDTIIIGEQHIHVVPAWLWLNNVASLTGL